MQRRLSRVAVVSGLAAAGFLVALVGYAQATSAALGVFSTSSSGMSPTEVLRFYVLGPLLLAFGAAILAHAAGAGWLASLPIGAVASGLGIIIARNQDSWAPFDVQETAAFLSAGCIAVVLARIVPPRSRVTDAAATAVGGIVFVGLVYALGLNGPHIAFVGWVTLPLITLLGRAQQHPTGE
jgi:hypothetical protein